MKSWTALSVALLMAAGGTALADYSVGQTVDDFSLPRAGGGTLTLSDYDGWVIHLWFFTSG